jgi:uncharacterized protein (DUF433 family)
VEERQVIPRSALVFHFEGMAEAGEPLPEPRGFDHYVRSDEHIADAGDLLTTIPADELLAAFSTAARCPERGVRDAFFAQSLLPNVSSVELPVLVITLDHSPVHSDPELMGGTLVFRGTRVSAQTLLDYLQDGCDLGAFLEEFPSVSRADAEEFLRLARPNVQS